jgi:hypothetical protein
LGRLRNGGQTSLRRPQRPRKDIRFGFRVRRQAAALAGALLQKLSKACDQKKQERGEDLDPITVREQRYS